MPTASLRVLSLLLVFTVFSSQLASGLKCQEDKIGPEDDDGSYQLNECDPTVTFCAKLRNDKTSEEFRACATPKMCTVNGDFDYQQHDELHISCCNKDGCNSAGSAGLSVVLFAAAVGGLAALRM
ncbi:hypothetical protein M3Y99_01706000 [Aphelenchoides fujianensis]|nr:hypothetical protein M3Y99_01706000 [Aphelenchoides fujianensis]